MYTQQCVDLPMARHTLDFTVASLLMMLALALMMMLVIFILRALVIMLMMMGRMRRAEDILHNYLTTQPEGWRKKAIQVMCPNVCPCILSRPAPFVPGCPTQVETVRKKLDVHIHEVKSRAVCIGPGTLSDIFPFMG